MSTRVFLLRDGKRMRCTVPFSGCDHALLAGPCPLCGAKDCKLQGTGKRPSADDRAWEVDAVAACCNNPAGVLRVEIGTLFGVREDEAVLRGRCRVY